MKRKIDYYGDILNLQELMALLCISEPTARQFCRSGKVKANKVGKEWRILKQSVVDYLAHPAV